jgi:type II secretory pathway component GspD/PulD (secretin)
MLSGLDSQTESITKEGIPVLSKIPILGLLFGTRSHEESQAEGVIIITPTVLDHVDRVGKQLLEDAIAKFNQFEGDFDE